MNLAAISLLSLVTVAEPQASSAPHADDVRQCVQRSLPFLEKEAVEWMQTKKCVTCHHIPMMLWTHFEARKHGFAVNEKAVEDLASQALAQYLEHPELTPTGQDTGFMEKHLGPGTVYLSLALAANGAREESAIKALGQFRDNFVARQNENGSWTTTTNSPPIVDGHDSMTMLILAALGDGDLSDKNREGRARALRWLKDTPLRQQSQPLALRIVVAAQSADKDEVSRDVELLRGLQQNDGGWNQLAGLSTDALVTGQALYALNAAGVGSDDPAVRRACRFLMTTQQHDGSWLVHTRNPNSHDPVISYYGTAWAVLGLLRTLPPRAATSD
jgi:Squalene-hopene cyclase C-terminal domain